MSLLEKIPTMEEAALRNLLDNARRLESNGTARQKADAAEILPALEAALAKRKANRLEAAAEKRARTRDAAGPVRRPARKAAAAPSED